jgi:hypothetical protein
MRRWRTPDPRRTYASEARSHFTSSSVQEVSQPDPGLLQLEFEHRVRLALIRGRDREWILAAQVSVRHRLSEPGFLQNPVLDAALDLLGPILFRDVAL